MFFPVRSDRRLQHTPWMNYALIALNVVIFLAARSDHGDPIRSGPGADLDKYLLDPTAPTLLQFITYQFLHADLMHLASNMIFLYVFGNSIEDRLGKLGYLAFYLAGGVLAGLGHALTTDARVLGASGAVAAVTGAYLALFPLSNVTIVYWFVFYIGAFEVSSIVLILFQIGQNMVMHLMGMSSGVAYVAHLSGYLYGFLVGMGLLWVRLLPREPYDLLALIEQRRRRARFRRMTRQGYQPWSHQHDHAAEPEAELTEAQQQSLDLRRAIGAAVGAHNLGQAAELYRRLLELDASQVMSQQQQLDIANQLMSDGHYDTAAHAYELFLNRFGSYAQREQVELILGLIYVRYLDKAERGRELLESALPRLRDDQQRELAEKMLRGE